jgi:hypothetical protein
VRPASAEHELAAWGQQGKIGLTQRSGRKKG